jgi:hypothetical protein
MNEDSPVEDFRALWTISAEDIRFFKSQQYSVANHAFALYAGIFALGNVSRGRLELLLPLAVGSLAIAVVACRQLYSLQKAITRHRDYGLIGKRGLSSEFKSKIPTALEESKTHEPGDVARQLMVVVAVAAGIAIASLM